MNMVVLAVPFRYQSSYAFEQSEIEAVEQVIPDEIHVQDVIGIYDKDTSVFAGTVSVVNEQGVPVADVVMTMQLVIGNRTAQIDQFTTDLEGIAPFSFVLGEPTLLWVEVLDVYGEGVDFSSVTSETRLVWYPERN